MRDLAMVVCLVACASERERPGWTEEHFCRDVDPNAPLRVVKTREAAAIYGDDVPCPARFWGCKSDQALAPGAEVILVKELAGLACVWHPSREGGDMGWVASRTLVATPAEPTPTWGSTWQLFDDEIEIEVEHNHDGAVARGHARWHGYGDNVHEGAFTGRLAIDPSGIRAVVVDESCQVRLRRVGAYLVVADNAACGGVNVRFDGVYTAAR